MCLHRQQGAATHQQRRVSRKGTEEEAVASRYFTQREFVSSVENGQAAVFKLGVLA